QTSILDRRASSFAGTSPRPARPTSNAAMGSAGRWKFAAPTAANLQRIADSDDDIGGLPRGDGPLPSVDRGRGGGGGQRGACPCSVLLRPGGRSRRGRPDRAPSEPQPACTAGWWALPAAGERAPRSAG